MPRRGGDSGRRGGNRWDDAWRTFPASTPLKVDGGLVTSRQRGAMAQTWWSRRFVEVLESYGLGARMQRGRRYARIGQTVSLDISPGLLAAQVQGSRPRPYLVTVAVAPPTAEQWRVVDEALASRVRLAANLTAGEVPAELEEVFAHAGAPLFPARWSDLSARCNCPDQANPCKHIAALLYLFADRLDEDPWLLLEWRGRTQAEVLAALGLAAGEAPAADVAPWWPLRPGESPPQPSQGPAGRTAGPAEAVPTPPAQPDAVLRRLDTLDAQAWHEPVAQSLPALYYWAVLDRAGPDRGPDGPGSTPGA